MDIAKTIKTYLDDQGIKQSHIAKKTGIKINAINLSLNGKRKLLADEYVSICNSLEVPLDFFIITSKEI